MLANPKLKPIGPFLKGMIVDYIGKPATSLRRYTLSTRRWHVVQTEPQQETRVEKALDDVGFGAFLPTVPKKQRIIRERYRTVMKPMLVGYVLAGFGPEDDWEEIMDMRGVLRVFMIEGRPVPLGEWEMQCIREAEQREREGKARTNGKMTTAKVKDLVQVKDGPFTHFFGFVVAVDNKKTTVTAEMDIFGRPTPVELDWDQIDVVLDRPAGIGAIGKRHQYKRPRSPR